MLGSELRKILEPKEREHFDLLLDFYEKHCPKSYKDNFIVSLDPEVVDFNDVVAIICNLLGFTFL